MPLVRTQSLLKKLLPRGCFALLYKFACSVYDIWRKITDEIYYTGSRIYYLLKKDDKNLKKIKTINLIRPYTMVGRTGLLATYDIANEIEENGIDGCFVECGVARGGCSAIMAMVSHDKASERKMWLFDSFEGLPVPTFEDESDVEKNPGTDRSSSALQQSFCLGTYEEVSTLLFSTLGLDRENVKMVKGWFQETLPEHKDKIGKISFLRIDGDWYESTKCVLENLYENVVTEGYIFIDDYHLSGCKKAVDEFLQQRGVDTELTLDGRGGAYFVKL